MNNNDDYDENDTLMVVVKWYYRYVPKSANWLAQTETMERVNPYYVLQFFHKTQS